MVVVVVVTVGVGNFQVGGHQVLCTLKAYQFGLSSVCSETFTLSLENNLRTLLRKIDLKSIAQLFELRGVRVSMFLR